MANLNKVFLMGNLTRDPELRYTPSGSAVTTLRLGVNRRFTTRQGENRDETLFIDVTVWGKQAETSCQYLSKGRPVLIEGRLRQDTWTTNEGQKRSRIVAVAERVQFLGPSPGDRTGAPRESTEPGESPDRTNSEEDEIPF